MVKTEEDYAYAVNEVIQPVPTLKEAKDAIYQLKKRKAARKDGI